MAGKARFELGSLTFDAPAGELATRARTKRLEPKAAAVLAALCAERGIVVSRQSLLDRCWGEGEGSDEALTQAVAQVRRAIEELGEQPELIETLAKRGYRLRQALPEAAALRTEAPNAGDAGPRRARRWAIAAAVVALVLTVVWMALPHGPRHFIKHSLGWGPPAAGRH